MDDAEEVFSLAENNEITGKDLFTLAARVMRYSQQVVEGNAASAKTNC